jgi:hypothetical protein
VTGVVRGKEALIEGGEGDGVGYFIAPTARIDAWTSISSQSERAFVVRVKSLNVYPAVGSFGVIVTEHAAVRRTDLRESDVA